MTKKRFFSRSKIRDGFLFLILAVLLATFIVGKNYSAVALDGMRLFAVAVFPSVFPYFFITSLLSSLSVTRDLSKLLSRPSKKIFNSGGLVGYAYFISLLSGYPAGAKTVSDLRKRGLLSDSESVRASGICSTSSPSFLISVVGGGIFGNGRFGALLFLSHLLSSLIIGFACSFYKRKDKPKNELYVDAPKADNVLYDCAFSSMISCLVAGGLITVFYVLAEMLLRSGLLNPLIGVLTAVFKDENLATGLSLGLFECTRAVKTVGNGAITFFTLPVLGAISGFGGLSVIAQSVAFLKNAKIKTAPFFFFKISGAIVNFLIGMGFSAVYLFV